MKNPYWNMPRISADWMRAHLSKDEQHQLLTIVQHHAPHHDLHTVQTFVPVSLVQILSNNADKADQQCLSAYETLVEKIHGFCKGVA